MARTRAEAEAARQALLDAEKRFVGFHCERLSRLVDEGRIRRTTRGLTRPPVG